MIRSKNKVTAFPENLPAGMGKRGNPESYQAPITCAHDRVSILEQDHDDIPVSILL